MPGVSWFLVKKATSQMMIEIKEMTMDIKKIKEKQEILREHLPIEYLRKNDYVLDIQEIKQMLRDLMAEIKSKVDKA